jgi:alcohol dehydrogenase
LDDEDAVLLSDTLPTGYFGAQLGDIAEGDVVAVWFRPGRLVCGEVGLADGCWAGHRVDHLEYRLEKARSFAVRRRRSPAHSPI